MELLGGPDQKLLEGIQVGTWVAISGDQSRVDGTGDTIGEALLQGQKQGVENPSVIRIPPNWGGWIF